MVEGQNNQGANPAIEWPRGIEPGMLQSLLEENREGAKLRNVVSRALVSESDSLSHPFGSNPPPSIDGFIIVASQLRDIGDFVDRYKDRAVEEITEDFSEQRSGSSALDKLRSLETILSRYQQLVPPGIDFDEPSGLPRHLIETMQRAEILKRDQTGFELVDFLAEQNSYQPDDPTNFTNFEEERRGRIEAARRYKELYNRLLANGATSD